MKRKIIKIDEDKCIGCGLCAREGSLISLSLVYDLVSQKAKKIMVLSHGKMIESGTHAELIKAGGLYKEMFELQAEGYLK